MSIELVLLGEILNLSRDDNVSLENFGQKVAASPKLAVEIVRVSNSALYGMEGKIDRLERAVLILGMRTVSQIASSVLVKAKMNGVQIGSLHGDQLWTHSLETGVCAQLIARCLSLPLESEAYLAGLLHDLGVVEMSQAHGARYADVVVNATQSAESLATAEQDAFGETHETKLCEIAADWGFRDLLINAIGHHHDPNAANDRSRPLATLLYAAHVVLEDHSEAWSDHGPSEQDEAVLSDLGLLPDDLEDIRVLTEERLKEVSGVFK